MQNAKRNEGKPSKESVEVLRLSDTGLADKGIAKRLDLTVAQVRAIKADRTMGVCDEVKVEAAKIERPTTFTWIPIYTELARKILAYKDRQSELINALKEVKASPAYHDQQETEIALGVIDPFTFFASFNIAIKKENRQTILANLKTKFDLESGVPTDFDGITVLSIENAWFLPYARERTADDIESLWTLAAAVVKDPPQELDPKLFERCLQIKTINSARLTQGMFWLNPKDYIAWDVTNRYLFEQNGIHGKIENLSTYLQLIEEVNAKLGNDYPQISRTACEQIRAMRGDELIPNRPYEYILQQLRSVITKRMDILKVIDVVDEPDRIGLDECPSIAVTMRILGLKLINPVNDQPLLPASWFKSYFESWPVQQAFLDTFGQFIGEQISPESPESGLKAKFKTISKGRPGKLPPRPDLRLRYQKLIRQLGAFKKWLSDEGKRGFSEQEKWRLLSEAPEGWNWWLKLIKDNEIALSRISSDTAENTALFMLTMRYDSGEDAIKSRLLRPEK